MCLERSNVGWVGLFVHSSWTLGTSRNPREGDNVEIENRDQQSRGMDIIKKATQEGYEFIIAIHRRCVVFLNRSRMVHEKRKSTSEAEDVTTILHSE